MTGTDMPPRKWGVNAVLASIAKARRTTQPCPHCVEPHPPWRSKPYRFAFLRVDPHYPMWNWGFVTLFAMIVGLAGFLIAITLMLP